MQPEQSPSEAPSQPNGDNAQPSTNQIPQQTVYGPVQSAQYAAPVSNVVETSQPAFTPSPVTPLFTPQNTTLQDNSSSDLPIAVVKALSIHGVEYKMMSIALWFGAAGLIWIILSLINGGFGFETIAFPVSLLIVCLPIFAALFIRVKKLEIAFPHLRKDASKRKLSQFTQLLAFLTCLFNLVGFVYLLLASIAGDSPLSLVKSFFSVVTVLVIAGGVLAYYWFDEHRNYNR